LIKELKMADLCVEKVGGPAFYDESQGIVEIPSPSGLCRFRFDANRSTGPSGSDTCPGMSIESLMDRHVYDFIGRHPYREGDTETYHSGGVVGRKGLVLLYKMLQKFLIEQGEDLT
jgi:hypothetical protein